MSALLKKYANLIKMLHKAPANKKKAILKQYCKDAQFIKCMCECSRNIIKGNVPLSAAQKTALSKRKKDLRKLARKKTSLKDKKRIVQKGGFLGSLIAPIASILGGLFSGSRS